MVFSGALTCIKYFQCANSSGHHTLPPPLVIVVKKIDGAMGRVVYVWIRQIRSLRVPTLTTSASPTQLLARSSASGPIDNLSRIISTFVLVKLVQQEKIFDYKTTSTSNMLLA